MKIVFSYFIVTLSVFQSSFAGSPLIDTSAVRFGLFAEFDGNINDRFGVRVRMDHNNILFGQFSFTTSAFNNNGTEFSSSDENNAFEYTVLLGYERRIITFLKIDCNIITALQYFKSRSLWTEEVYRYPPGEPRIFERFAGVEKKSTSYQFFLGIGAEYTVTEQLSLELVKRFLYAQNFGYATNAESAPSTSRSVRTGFDDVFMNVIYYF